MHDHSGERARADRRALGGALALTATFMGRRGRRRARGRFAGSDRRCRPHAHRHGRAFGLALGASWIAGRPSTPARSFGFRRAEILAAFANAVLLVAIAIWIFVEAYGRLREPPEVLAGWVLAVGVVGVLVNLGAAVMLGRSHGSSLNRRAAFTHVLTDLLGSVGVIVAAVVVLATGWREADPLVSLFIGALVLASSWTILRDSIGILLEGTPRGIDAEEVGNAMAAAGGVHEVHDLHIWTITSGFPSLSAHGLVAPGTDCHRIRLALERLLADRFGLTHTTLQVEHAASRRIELTSRVPR